MKNINDAIATIEQAMSNIARELNNPNLPDTGPISRRKLIEFLNVLELMKKKLHGDEPIEKSDLFGYGLGQAIVDSWPYDNPLGLSIISAEQQFIRSIRKEFE